MSLETQRPPIYMLDVDGVVTSPETKRPNPKILAFIANCLLKNRPIAMATTRDFAWLDRFVISPIRPYLSLENMSNLFVSAEKAAVSVSFSNGQAYKEVDTSVMVPDQLREAVKRGLEEQGRAGIFNYPKEAVHTIEIKGGMNKEETVRQQVELDEFYRWLQVEIMQTFPNYKADRTAIAIDIYHRSGNKMLSAQRFVEFLRKRGMDLQGRRFIAIGDGRSDMEMAIGFRDEGLDVIFGWVGKPEDTPYEEGTETIVPGTGKDGINDKGTVDLLAYFGEISTLN